MKRKSSRQGNRGRSEKPPERDCEGDNDDNNLDEKFGL